MQWVECSREEMVGPYTDLWNLDCYEAKKAENQALNEYIHLVEGSFETHWLLRDGSETVATVSGVDWNAKAERKVIGAELVIRPGYEGLVLSSAIGKLEEIRESATGQAVTVWIADRMVDRQAGLESAGFKVVEDVPVTRLNLEEFEPERWADRIAKVEESGLRLVSIRELEAVGLDWVPGLYHGTREMADDIPTVHRQEAVPLDKYREMIVESSVYFYDLMFVAMDGDRIVSYTRAMPSEAMPELVHTGLSGTVRSHRRRGLVTALKAKCATTLKARGYRLLQTENTLGNPMYQINLELGFRDAFAWKLLERSAAGSA